MPRIARHAGSPLRPVGDGALGSIYVASGGKSIVFIVAQLAANGCTIWNTGITNDGAGTAMASGPFTSALAGKALSQDC